MKRSLAQTMQPLCASIASVLPMPEELAAMFSPQRSLILDDTHTFRVNVYRGTEGNMGTAPLNGAIYLLTPSTGDLLIHVVHKSIWKNRIPPGRSASQKSAELACAALSELPPEDFPELIFTHSIALAEALRAALARTSNNTSTVTVIAHVAKFGLHNLLRVPRVDHFVRTCSEDCTLRVNAYSDWLNTVSPLAAYVRLRIITIAFEKRSEETRRALGFPSGEVMQQSELWPCHTAEEWAVLDATLMRTVAPQPQQNQEEVSDAALLQMRCDILGLAPPARSALMYEALDAIGRPVKML